ncbi:GNAT family N-acetyltransferase [Stackebrandtia albiflava]|uniref:GNAT family N-acetyltransferase n=1 Tax=Stackebrandtia albiflava TaxID=406432 RepID=UPI0013152BD5|nr:GNAT family N-acetyltransferase [Stackebrandtia albiflava]
MALSLDRGWSPESRKWRFLLEHGTGHGVVDDSGRLIAAVTVTGGEGRAAVGMMLVARDHARRGIGERLMRHVLSVSHGSLVTLYATAAGRRLYRRLGFEDVSPVTTHVGRFVSGATPPGRVRPATPEDLDAIAAVDRAAHGSDRRALLSAFAGLADRTLVVTGPDGGVTGFAARWRNDGTMMIGPVVAAGDSDALALIGRLAEDSDLPVRLDLEHRLTAVREWATAHGLAPGFDTTLMAHGRSDLPGSREHRFQPMSVAIH